MSTQCFSGIEIAKKHEEVLTQKIQEYRDRTQGNVPCLTTIQVGNHQPSKKFIELKTKKGRDLGINVQNVNIPENVGLHELYSTIERLGADQKVHGIMVQHPLPERLYPATQYIYNRIPSKKDVDGLTTTTLGRILSGIYCACYPSAAWAVMRTLEYYNVELEGAQVAIFGASNLLGKPLAAMLINQKATVTIFNKSTEHFFKVSVCKQADIIIGACGAPHVITPEFLTEGVILIDAGYNDGKGDVDPACYQHSSGYTPVPGGIGPLTINTLLSQTVYAALKSLEGTVE